NKETGKKEIGFEEISTKIDTFNYLKKVSEKKSNVETAIKAKEALKVCLSAEVSAKEKKVVKVK
ncbi:MAG: hypothetical protein NC899_05705, partial [Candidatus Omnitrophica bacterium]|nr:hypothetical protein [Candidatus Omnitrophota bacterium]